MSIFTEVFDFIKKVFGDIPTKIKEYAAIAIGVVNQVKALLESDTVDDILKLIPTDVDDKLRDEALSILNGMIEALKSISGLSIDEKAKTAAKAGIYLKMGSKIVELQDGKKLKPNRYDFYTQVAYSKIKE